MRVLFAGGGTLGSVSPLIAIHQALKQAGHTVDALWLGTANGPEREVVIGQGMAFQSIVAPKLRRYFDWRTLILPFSLFAGGLQALAAVRRFAPDVVVTAGSFVAIPVGIAARLRRVPLLIHQQDVLPSLTNRVLSSLAAWITVTFSASLTAFPARKTTVTGNPVRSDMRLTERGAAMQTFQFSSEAPTLLVLGGGTGAAALNQLVITGLQSLVEYCQVIHLTGRGKMAVVAEHPRYRAFEFLGAEMSSAYAAADLVVSRAGMSVLSELSAFRKPAVLVPIPHSHQVANAVQFARQNAALLMEQPGLTATEFVAKIREAILDAPLLANLGRNISNLNPPDAAQKVADIARRLAGEV